MDKLLFVGLGNPGKEYAGTRHNLGAFVLRAWCDSAANREYAHVSCLLPTMSMNNSGQALANYLGRDPMEVGNILILHDDLELPLGEIRLTGGGSAKGHNGVRSIHAMLDTQDVARLRLGLGRPPEGVDARDYVLMRFTEKERDVVDGLLQKTADILSRVASEGIVISNW